MRVDCGIWGGLGGRGQKGKYWGNCNRIIIIISKGFIKLAKKKVLIF